jgi:hypothetical protein
MILRPTLAATVVSSGQNGDDDDDDDDMMTYQVGISRLGQSLAIWSVSSQILQARASRGFLRSSLQSRTR